MASDSKIALLCAYTLASAEHYGEAEALILSDTELAKTPEAMDLLARIRTEQGDFAEARRLWQEIQTIHPEHKPSAVALKALLKHPRRFSCRALWVGALILGLLLGVLLGGFCGSCGEPAEKEPLAVLLWDDIPTAEKMNALVGYKGQVKRILISSSFFNHPKRVANRELLTQYLASLLEVPTDAIYLGAPLPGQAPDAIRVELESK